MTRRRLCLTLVAAVAASAQESFQTAGQHPALLLPERRLRRLRLERERQTPRWQQFEALIAGQAQMPEPGFAQALYHQVALDAGAGRRAVEWALGGQTDLRQLALVFDWCQQAMTEKQAAELAARLERSLARSPASAGVPEARSRVFAAIAIADRAPAASERELRRAVAGWWHGRDTLPRTDQYALLELLHAVRDSLGTGLEESAPDAFRQLALVRLLSYYPEPDGDYRLPAVRGGAPGVHDAEMARMADMALVAYDPNGLGSQYLQGWLMHDRFALQSPFGAPYEFLWADPYLPGLSYYHAPLLVHDTVQGLLFIRSSWDDGALWAGVFGGELQTFSNGKATVVSLDSPKSLEFNGSAVAVTSGKEPLVFNSPVERIFLVGLRPGRTYRIHMGRHNTREERADSGGIAEMEFPEGYRGALWLTEAH